MTKISTFWLNYDYPDIKVKIIALFDKILAYVKIKLRLVLKILAFLVESKDVDI